MGQIGKWIDAKCQSRPEIMRRVLGRKFGDLSQFFGVDGKCGCLVGSWELESGRGRYSMERTKEDEHVGNLVYSLTRRYQSPAETAPQWSVEVRYPHLFGEDLNPKRPDAFVIRLLKQRIRKALGLAPVPHGETAVVVHGSRGDQ